MKKILTFRVCAEWFTKLKNGIVENRFRENTKHWQSRLLDKEWNFKKFDEIEIINGYNKDSPRARVEFGWIQAIINAEWIPGFEIQLGKILEIQE